MTIATNSNGELDYPLAVELAALASAGITPAAWPKSITYRNSRHHCATWWHNVVGYDWEMVAKYLGHKHIGITQAYYVRAGDDADEQAQRLLRRQR